MLNAILNGKAGTVPDGVKPGDSWKSIFRFNEDLLTATILERLSYLDAPLFWLILQSSFAPDLLPRGNVADLKEFSLWPRWTEASTLLGKSVIPDALIRFEVGDPATEIILILEAKLDGSQNAQQWAQEWIAYHSEGERDESAEVYLVALGGLYGQAKFQVLKLADEANTIINELGGVGDLKAVGADWSDLATAIYDLSHHASSANRRILHDIKEALALRGYRQVRLLADLPADAHNLCSLSDHSMEILRPWNVPKVAPTTGLEIGLAADWVERTSLFRPLGMLIANWSVKA
jgi:hypothetical protein